MEKMIYLLSKHEKQPLEDFKSALLGPLIDELRSCGASRITVNIADLNDTIQADAPGRLIGAWQDVSAAVAVWHDCLDQRGPIEANLERISASTTGYLVTESVPQSFSPDWEGGDRRPGVTQFGANAKPENVSDEEFYHNWQVVHSASSFELHPKRWSYVRNAVARPLTKNAPTYRAVVSEHFRELEDFTHDSRYFGSEAALHTMIEEIPGFCDLNNMFSLAMSEYYFE